MSQSPRSPVLSPSLHANLGSHKAKDIKGNSRVALLLYWHELHRQVKIQGTAERNSVAEDARYFMRRPRDSQLGAWVSRQSSLISARSLLPTGFRTASGIAWQSPRYIPRCLANSTYAIFSTF